MQTLEFYALDSFTSTRFAGNPAGVFFHDGTLSPEQMQAIAGEVHLESAFLSPPLTPDADYTVVYYTGMQRIPLCGHDTIAAATVLVHSGRLSVPGTARFATDIGIVLVSIDASGNVTMTQALPLYGAIIPAAPLADTLGLAPHSLAPFPAQVVTTGTHFAFLAFQTRAALDALLPDWARLASLLASLPGAPVGLYAWTRETLAPDAYAYARCFCPGIGLPEDPATGSASGAYGCYLVKHGLIAPAKDGSVEFRTEQGFAMGRPSGVSVNLQTQSGVVTQAQVSGRAVLVAEGRLHV